MADPIKIMDEIEKTQVPRGWTYKNLTLTPNEWQSLRTAIEAQAEELAQKEARIARLHDALEDTINLCNLTGDEAITRDEDLLRAEKIRDEPPRQSLAAVKAELVETLNEAIKRFPVNHETYIKARAILDKHEAEGT